MQRAHWKFKKIMAPKVQVKAQQKEERQKYIEINGYSIKS